MREKLVELIKNGGVIIPQTAEAVADYLIENNVIILPEKMKDSWELTSAFVLRLFCSNDEEVTKIKQEFELQKVKKILIDIRDFLAKKQQAIEKSEINVIVKEVALGLLDAEIVALKRYAEELGVEL